MNNERDQCRNPTAFLVGLAEFRGAFLLGRISRRGQSTHQVESIIPHRAEEHHAFFLYPMPALVLSYMTAQRWMTLMLLTS
ncbi:hypothetical protein GGR51DRAFT_565878 [Nemania sp. FL0031]|nr:hypothetical protein GGR51DRAFT_565878 [Nemania sp. FL0031]